LKQVAAALWAEALKAYRSRVFLMTLLFSAFVAMMLGLLMYVANHPEIAGRSATMAMKSSRLGDGNWVSLMAFLVQAGLALGQLGFGIVTSWVFGREFVDHVAKDLLALPTTRTAIVAAKFSVVIAWNILLSVTFFVVALATGWAENLPGWSPALFRHTLAIFSSSVLLTLLLCPPVAFVAGASRGYLLPIGLSLLAMITAQLLGMGLPGLMRYFPWAIPALASGAAGASLPPATFISYAVLVSTGIAGLLATVLWWRSADQT
jgi:ABC-2 type transport system permease protein